MKRFQRTLVVLLSAILLVTACIPFAGAGEQTRVESTGAPETEGTIVPETETADTTAPTEDTAATEPDASAETTETAEPTESTAESTAGAAEETTEETAEAPHNATDIFTVSFDLNGGIMSERDGDFLPIATTVYQVVTLPMAPEKEERTFAGWKSASTGEIYDAEADYEVTGDDILTAQWNMLQLLTVTAAPEDGSALRSADNVVAAISEDEQEKVSDAVDAALREGPMEALDVLAADISFESGGEELQPAEDESVPVTLTVPGDRIDSDAAFLVVYHMAEQADGSYFAEPVQYVPRTEGTQEVSFGATGFSVYAVASVGKKADDEGSTLISGDGDISFSLEEEQSQVFYFLDENASQYTYHRYVWSVKDNDGTIQAYSTSIYFHDKTTVNDESYKFQYPWVSVDALRPGTATLAVTYYCYNGRSWWNPTGTVASGTVELQITVTEKENGLALENRIAENGTLVPVWRGENNEAKADHYRWQKFYFYSYNRGDGSPEAKLTESTIDDAAIQPDGSINVAIDAGGISEETNENGLDYLCIKYYVYTAYDKDGNIVGQANHRVQYGEDILNGSFEYPRIPSGFSYDFANGTRQLFWKTTAPGSGSTLGMDVELGNDSTGNPYLIAGGTANDGDQFAELNAEVAGSLYQDVLTAPGSNLTWAFAHRSRMGTGVNVMYLVIAAAKDAQNITTQTEINKLIANYVRDGAAVNYNGGTFTLWKFEGNESYWQNHYGEYTVPDGQYATRFFFISATGTTLGNLLDGVHFNESQRYVVEYYLNDQLQSSLTEISTAEMDTVVVPKNTESDLLKNAILTGSTINGDTYGGVTLSIKARATTDVTYEGCRNVLRLYYTTGTASVRKVVEIEGWDNLTADEKSILSNGGSYTASFYLYDGTEHVATASVNIDLVEYAQKTAVAVFMDVKDPTKPFAPASGHGYRVVEDESTSNFSNIYSHETVYEPAAGGTAEGGLLQTDAAATGSCTVRNLYAPKLTTLTIRKEGWQAIDENQTFVYRVQGLDNALTKNVSLTVTIHGNGSTTIDHLPLGSYRVTEVTGWSWRYTPAENDIVVDLDSPSVVGREGGATVTFTNTRAEEIGGGDHWRWLNGSAWADNRWLDGKKLNSGDNEGGEGNG